MIKLKPITARFKRLIHDFGDEWVIIHEPRPMICFGGQFGVTCHPKSNPNKLSNFKLEDLQWVVFTGRMPNV